MPRRRYGHREATPGTHPPNRQDHSPRRVLVLSASMGAGHDGAARELAQRLTDSGHEVEVRDFVESAPLRIGAVVKGGYKFELSHAPSMYDATYRFWDRAAWLCPAIAWLVCLLTGRRVMRWVRRWDADVVVSTYPLSTLCVGRLRASGRLRVPAVNFITDFGVHPLWVHKGIDLNLAVHQLPAAAAAARSGRPSIACGPLVAAAYGPTGAGAPGVREAARTELGLAANDVAVLIVAGSWGIGGIGDTFEAISGNGRYVPVVVCGRDTALQRRVTDLAAASAGRSVVLGWTDEMPRLMAASDALIENAGGLTSLEAMRVGLPVISYQPIAGHGKDNTAAMDSAGVSRLAADRDDLLRILTEVTTAGPARRRQVAAGRAMFAGDGAADVLDASAGAVPRALVSSGRRPARRAVRATAAAAGLSALVWGGMTTGVGVAAAAGAGVAHGNARAGDVAYLGVRLSADEVGDPTVDDELRALDISAIVDRSTALEVPAAVRDLAARGVDVENGGQGGWHNRNGGSVRPTLWSRARGDVRASTALRALTGEPVTVFVPGRRVNAFDLVDCKDAHTAVVVPDVTWSAADSDGASTPVHLTAGHIYLVNGLGATPPELTTLLQRLNAGLDAQQLSAAPLARLR